MTGTTLRTFRPGRDEQEWLSLNGRAFAKHPEQGAWGRHDLEVREQEPWFDPAGFDRFRALWQMRRPLRDPLDPPRLPAGTTLRTFRPGHDDQEWLSLNARAFAKHPEQGAWTRHDLELREQEPWFDPAGFFLAERNGVMTGFHWTKVPGPAEADQGLGEVYVVGVDPGERGTGLGRALTLAGLGYLRDRGLAGAMLYVDEDNVAAIRMYKGLGFTRWSTDAMYRQRAL